MFCIHFIPPKIPVVALQLSRSCFCGCVAGVVKVQVLTPWKLIVRKDRIVFGIAADKLLKLILAIRVLIHFYCSLLQSCCKRLFADV